MSTEIKFIKKLLNQRGIKQTHIAKKLKVSKQYVNAVLNGRQKAPVGFGDKVRRILDK